MQRNFWAAISRPWFFEERNMARLLSKNIVAKAAEKSGIEAKYLGLEYDSGLGTWYWIGKAPICIDHGETHMQRLGDWTLEQWVDDWCYEVKKFELDNNVLLSDYIKSIRWSD